MLTDEQINMMVEAYKRRELRRLSDIRRLHGPAAAYLPESMRDDGLSRENLLQLIIEHQEQEKQQLKYAVQFNEVEGLQGEAAALMQEHGFNDSESIKLLAEYILKTKIGICSTVIKRMKGDFSEEPAAVPAAAAVPAEPARPVKKLSDLWDEHRAEAITKKSWRVSTASKNDSAYKRLVSLLGNKPLASYDKADARKIIDSLQKQKLSVSTINYSVELMSTLWKRALKHQRLWGVEFNPFCDMQVHDEREESEKRLPFDAADLSAIFKNLADLKIVKRESKPLHYFGPLIALYTGMRLNEVAQLRVADIVQADGVWIFHIRHDSKQQQSTKNGTSRTCPVHPMLQRLGLLEYVAIRAKKRNDRLFEKGNDCRAGRWGGQFGKWFNRTFLVKTLENKDNKSFHSTRHTFINWFVHNVKLSFSDLAVLKSMVGHLDGAETKSLTVDGGITTGVYSNKYSPAEQLALLKKLNYGVEVVI